VTFVHLIAPDPFQIIVSCLLRLVKLFNNELKRAFSRKVVLKIVIFYGSSFHSEFGFRICIECVRTHFLIVLFSCNAITQR